MINNRRFVNPRGISRLLTCRNLTMLLGVLIILLVLLAMISVVIMMNRLEEVDDWNFSKPEVRGMTFENPWNTWKKPTFSELFYFLFVEKSFSNVPNDIQILDKELPLHQITDKEISEFCKKSDRIKVIWIGHSTILINFENKIILVDPIFSERASPISFIGKKRFRPVPISIERIPKIDVILISHNHYDHLDYESIRILKKEFGETDIHWFMGDGNAKWFRSVMIYRNVYEFSWWESKKFHDLEFVFTPAQHWSRRKLNDENKALWGGWAVKGRQGSFYFAGDTGYCSVFKEIGDKLGHFNISFIPIGAYNPRWFMQYAHVDPEEAVQVHLDVKSQKSIGIHWGTFSMGYEFYLEPKTLLSESLAKKSLDNDSFITLQHGKIYDF